MHSKLIGLTLLALLASCMAMPQQDQRKWESVSCSGFKGWDACMKQSALTCAKGFDVRDKEENQVTQARSMLFACKL